MNSSSGSNNAKFLKPASRRRLLELGVGAAVFGLTGAFSQAVKASLTVDKRRDGWRFCTKCNVMFSTKTNNGVCAAGGNHSAAGYYFRLPYDQVASASIQSNWLACRACQALFFWGFSGKGKLGRCPATKQGHLRDPDDLKYTLTHDVPGTAIAQNNWRFCGRCFAMFFDGFPTKGVCAAGGSHEAAGYNFVLPHTR